MKTILFILIVFSAFFSNGQNPCDDKAGGWHLEMSNTYLPLSYEVQTDSITTITSLYIMANGLSGATNVRMFNNIIFLEVKNLTMNLNKYGLPRMSTSIYALSPINFNASITYFKGGYKVKVSGIVSEVQNMFYPSRNENYNWDYDNYRKDGCLKKLGYSGNIETLITVEKYFKDFFKI